MSRLDHTLYAFTQHNPGGPVIQYIEDEMVLIEPSVDSSGNLTRASLIGYILAYAIAFVTLAYFLLV